MKEHQKLLTLVEGALCIAMSYALSFLKFKIWAEGGSIDIVMVPLLIYAWRRGTGWGIAAGLLRRAASMKAMLSTFWVCLEKAILSRCS